MYPNENKESHLTKYKQFTEQEQSNLRVGYVSEE